MRLMDTVYRTNGEKSRGVMFLFARGVRCRVYMSDARTDKGVYGTPQTSARPNG